MRACSVVLFVAALACTSRAPVGARLDASGGLGDATLDASPDAPSACHATSGAAGQCLATATCATLADHAAATGDCAQAAPITCCIDAPDVADNPPTPPGYKLMTQAQVTPAMTTWALAILHDPATYPMFATTTRTFAGALVLARVEWHPPDFQNHAIHRGVTLYVPV